MADSTTANTQINPGVHANGQHAPTNGAANGADNRPVFTFKDGWHLNIPSELLGIDQWLCWRFGFREKWTKSPFCPRKVFNASKGRFAFKGASSTDPATWGSIEEAFNFFATSGHNGKPRFLDGVGFAFSPDDPFCGWDLDHCLDEDGSIMEWALPYLARLSPTYYEVSPSGRGLKGICLAKLSGKGTKKGGLGPDGKGAVELYDRGRFFTITGDRHRDATEDIRDCSAGVLEVYGEIKPDLSKPRKTPKQSASSNGKSRVDRHDDGGSIDPRRKEILDQIPDADLLQWARHAKNGRKFIALYDEGSCSGFPSDSEADFSLLCKIAFWTGCNAARMEQLFSGSARGQREKWGRADYRETSIANAIAATQEIANLSEFVIDVNEAGGMTIVPKPKAPPESPRWEGDGQGSEPDWEKIGDQEAEEKAKADSLRRVQIEITPLRYEVLKQTIAVMSRNRDIYSRGEFLVTIGGETEDELKLTRSTTLAKTAGAASILMLSDAVLGCYLTRNAEFWQEKTSKDGEPHEVEVHPPNWLISAVATHKRWRGIRPLIGVADCPFPREDGSLVTVPGYDDQTGYYLRPSIDFPEVPDRPTQEDARAAWERLKRIVGQFPFSKDDDRAVWLAGLLTKVARPGIHAPVPGIVVIGNKPSTGKGLLVDTIGILTDGRPIPTTAYPVDPIEAAKVDLAIAVAGKGAVHYDNIEEGTTYGNSALDSALTSITVDGRILGTSKMSGEIDRRAMTFASGNNISPGKDAHRRWLPCNVFSSLERPEERGDIEIADLRSHLMEHRGEYVRDTLVILKAHALAGRPNGGWSPLGSFEKWDQMIRGAVWFAGAGDCCATRRAAADDAPARMAKVALLDGWLELSDGKSTAAKAVEAVFLAPSSYPTLHNALIHYGRDGKLVTARSLGNIIRGMKGNLIDGKMFQQIAIEHQAVVWIVKKVVLSNPNNQDRSDAGQSEGESGESGESDSHSPRTDSASHTDVNVCGGIVNAVGVSLNETPRTPQTPLDDDREGGEL